MVLIDAVISSLRDVISGGVADSLTEVRISYDLKTLPNPLRKIYIILNPSKITVSPYRDDYSPSTKKIDFVMKIDIYRSELSDPAGLFQVFSQTLSTLDESHVFTVDEASCGEIKSDPDTNAICLPCIFKFSVSG